MSSSGRDLAAGRAPAPPPVDARPTPVRLDDALVVDVLARLAGAGSALDVGDAAPALLVQVPAVRAAAVVLREGAQVVIVGSAGYDCGVMGPGSVLPLDSGLPVTEAVRTGRDVVQGSGPGWVAVPFGARAGALLLSLHGAAPERLDHLHRIARAVGDALSRCSRQELAEAELATVTAALALPPAAPGEDVAVRSLPYDGPVGGDVALCLPDGRGGRWLIAADVCGSGLRAAVVARAVQATFTALAAYAPGPAALLTAADGALRSSVPSGLFVTATVVHETGDRLVIASAGHPAPLLLTATGARTLVPEAGLPLALDSGQDVPRHRELAFAAVPHDAVLLLHTDGLVDRRRDDGPVAADPLALVAGRPLDDLEALADQVLAAAAQVGAPGDDLTLLLARRLG